MGAHLTGVVADPHKGPAAAWRSRLRTFLADHEVPDRVLVVDSVPLLPNGKLDRVRLTEHAREARREARRGADASAPPPERAPSEQAQAGQAHAGQAEAEHRVTTEQVAAAGGTP